MSKPVTVHRAAGGADPKSCDPDVKWTTLNTTGEYYGEEFGLRVILRNARSLDDGLDSDEGVALPPAFSVNECIRALQGAEETMLRYWGGYVEWKAERLAQTNIRMNAFQQLEKAYGERLSTFAYYTMKHNRSFFFVKDVHAVLSELSTAHDVVHKYVNVGQ